MLRSSHRRAAVLQQVTLMNAHIRDSLVIPAKEGDVLPDTFIRQSRAPVPAKHAVSLPEIRETLHCFDRAAKVMFLVPLCNPPRRRLDTYLQFISALQEQTSHIELVSRVHIHRRPDPHPVQVDVRDGIDAIKAKHLMSPTQKRRICVKRLCEGVITLHKLQRLVFIIPVERVLHLACIQKETVDRSGNFPLGLVSIRCQHAPCSIQCKGFHVVNLLPPQPLTMLHNHIHSTRCSLSHIPFLHNMLSCRHRQYATEKAENDIQSCHPVLSLCHQCLRLQRKGGIEASLILSFHDLSHADCHSFTILISRMYPSRSFGVSSMNGLPDNAG